MPVTHVNERLRAIGILQAGNSIRNVAQRFGVTNGHQGPSLMVWGGVTATHRTQLVIVPGNMNGTVYRDTIVRPHILPFIRRHGAVFQQDNARPHVARVVTQFVQQQNIPTLPWPAVSPDLSPIEHVWDEMKRRLRNLPNQPQNMQQLARVLVRLWNNIPQQFLARVVRSMRQRVLACIQARGGHTRY